MSDDAFLAAIRARPDDDLPREVYADWLDERGTAEAAARAEFIRVQCEMERIRGKADPRQGVDFEKGTYTSPPEFELFIALRSRSEELLADKNFLISLWPSGVVLGPAGFTPAPAVRGFVEEFTCAAADWLAHGDAITAQHPVRTVRLTDRPRKVSLPENTGWRFEGRERVHSRMPVGSMTFVGDRSLWPTVRVPTDEEMLAAEWPGVAFELPPERPPLSEGSVLRLRAGQEYMHIDGTEFRYLRADRDMELTGYDILALPANSFNYAAATAAADQFGVRLTPPPDDPTRRSGRTTPDPAPTPGGPAPTA